MDKRQGHDSHLPPRPEGGWSCALVSLPDALVVPSTVPDLVQPAGVFDAAGRFVPEAVLWRGRPLMVEPPRPAEAAALPGRWIWGGVLLNHFGHFLTETTGRLWALDALEGPVDGIVFISKREEADAAGEIAMQAWHRQFFAMLGIDLPVRILTAPTRVGLLEVPGQGFGIGPIASGTEAFRAFIRSRFARDVPAEGPADLYISRSALSAVRGGVIGETRIEEALAAIGYEVLHPQKHPLEEQVARYKAARRIVALDGSALHLLAMAGGPHQRVAVIKRRDSGASESILRHLAAFTGQPPLVIDAILRDWVRSDRRRADRHSVGEIDFAALGPALVAGGFAPPGFAIAPLTEAESRAAVAAIEEKLRRGGLTFRPVPRGAAVPPPPPPAAQSGPQAAQQPGAAAAAGPSRRELRLAR
ncbi:MAG: glycosyltransferase family 61 protein, partial [Rhodobacteraceae bacterium]|nr:glycosyltransferase family 61 protein [Paracoccaceae bacterium]